MRESFFIEKQDRLIYTELFFLSIIGIKNSPIHSRRGKKYNYYRHSPSQQKKEIKKRTLIL